MASDSAFLDTNCCADYTPTNVTPCSESLYTNSSSKSHVSITDKIRRLTCEQCNKVFSKKQALQRHTILHTNVSRFMCTHCDYSAPSNATLLLHVRIKHTGEKPFKCTECPYACARMTELNRHGRTHVAQKPYQCVLCDFGGTTRQHLMRHVKRIHANHNSYKCPMCPKSFVDKPALAMHLPVHSSERPFSCADCGSKFKTNPQLGKHRKTFCEKGIKPTRKHGLKL